MTRHGFLSEILPASLRWPMVVVMVAVTALTSACAAMQATPGEEAAKIGQPPQAVTAEKVAALVQREAPEFPSPTLAYKLNLPEGIATWNKKIIYADEVWRGDLLVVQPVMVTKTGSLTIAEGATIYFDVPNGEDDRKTPWLTVRGKLFIRGTGQAPVRLTSVFIRHHDNQDIVNAVEARALSVDHTIFERGGWGLHIHDTATEVRAATFRDNYGGARFKSENISFTGSRFEGNRIGVRLLNSTGAAFIGNAFTDNLTGIFFRGGVKTPTIKHNNFDNYEYDIKLGESQSRNIDISANWWKNATRADLEEFIYDGKDSEGVGTVYIAPPANTPYTLEQP